ncbi:MAG: DUF177 domain-containing protein [Polyangiaceae bacterium]|nr:DUF177 domain-containing protein [Polyangiaceae bacterium]
MTKPEHLLEVHDLDAAGKAYASPLEIAWVTRALDGCDVTPTGPGRVEVRFSRSGDDVVVRGRITQPLTAPCARCLGPATIDVDTELSLLLVPAASQKAAYARGRSGPPDDPRREETSPADADLDVYEGDHVALDGFVREAILLEVPPFPLCSASCPGIGAPPEAPVTTAGDIDPRLQPLLALSARLKKDGKD